MALPMVKTLHSRARRLAHQTAVDEIFDVQLLPGLRFPEVIGFQPETTQHTIVVQAVRRAP
jgi:hypothetical protein